MFWNKWSHLEVGGLQYFTVLCPVKDGLSSAPETTTLYIMCVCTFANVSCHNYRSSLFGTVSDILGSNLGHPSISQCLIICDERFMNRFNCAKRTVLVLPVQSNIVELGSDIESYVLYNHDPEWPRCEWCQRINRRQVWLGTRLTYDFLNSTLTRTPSS